MYWSKYNILTKSNKFGYLLFNTMSQVFIQIDDSDISDWDELKDNPDSFKTFSNSDFLLKSRIIVSNQEDDLNVYLADVLKNKYNPTDVALTILPTRGCNFGCIYCYEQDRPTISMTEDVEEGMIKFLKSNSNLKRLSVVWYGGEPLMNYDSIVRLTAKFKELEVEYAAKMVTNGYLLNESIANNIENLDIKNIQITLDGSEEVHNQRRALLGGQPTYAKIIKNLKYLLSVNKTVTIDIRTNIDTRNKDDYHKFYQCIRSDVPDQRVNLYPGFVSDLLSSECVSPEYNISEGSYKAQFALDIFNTYGIEIKSFLPKYRRHSCVATKYFAFVIGPEGEMYKCWRMVGNKEQTVGNVKNGTFDIARFSKYIAGANYTSDPKCLDCEFITLCGGGCPLTRMRNKYEGLTINHCCPEKSHMTKLMELRYEMKLKAQNNG